MKKLVSSSRGGLTTAAYAAMLFFPQTPVTPLPPEPHIYFSLPAGATLNQLVDQGAQIDHAAGTAQQMVTDAKVGTKLLKELKWRIFKEKLCMFTLILVRAHSSDEYLLDKARIAASLFFSSTSSHWTLPFLCVLADTNICESLRDLMVLHARDSLQGRLGNRKGAAGFLESKPVGFSAARFFL